MRRGTEYQSYYVLGHKTANIRDLYTLGRKLGQGQFGTTYLCTEISTGIEYASKSIAKTKLISKEDVEDVRREIQIMHHLAGHKNIVTIKGAYEDPLFVHIVMELCGGGELFDRIIQRGHYTERKATAMTKIIVGVVEACHSVGVMHRDLKPENFLLVNKDDDFSLKAIDFGLSVFFKPGQVFTDVVGSPYYVAPEVLLKHYGPEADVWTAGVILYILLSGLPPFWAETQQGIFDAVLDGYIDFESDPWPVISDSAKDLIRKMLCSRPSERITAHEVLCHPWICETGVAPDRALDPAVLSLLKQFSVHSETTTTILNAQQLIAQEFSMDNAKKDSTNNNSNSNLPLISPRKDGAAMRRGTENRSYYVLGHKTANIRDLYTLGRKLGQGQFGTTYLCTEISTGIEYACKSIAKIKLISKEDVEDVRREIQIMHHLAGHKNIVTIKCAYEDPLFVHIVMELCGGGELFERIIQRGHYCERKAAALTKIIVGVVEACHSVGVMHRDLKPENFLLVNKDDDFSLKAINFGLSVFFNPGQVFTDVVGSPYYVAPEVLLKHHGPEADVWTAGVMLYVLLSGVPPFWAETRQGIFDVVLKGYIDFESDPWPVISDSAKDLIRKMLCSQPSERITAHEVLCHPWICETGVDPDRALDPAALSHLNTVSCNE